MRPTRFWCAECGAETVWMLADQLATILGVCHRTIYYWLERGRVHNRKLTSAGLRLFCLCSVCGQRERGCNEGDETKKCKGVQDCVALVLATLQEPKQTLDRSRGLDHRSHEA